MLIETSGNIRSQIGHSINAMRTKVEMGDAIGLADHLAFLIAICSPKLSTDEMKLLSIPPMPAGKDRGGSKQRELFTKCMSILAQLLVILSEKNLYAYKDVPIGDASDLALSVEEVPTE